MNSSSRKKFPMTNIGSVSLLMIFIVLCMVTFAALSLSSASYDARSAEKSAAHTTAYYQASNKAETVLAAIDQQLNICRTVASDSAAYYQLLQGYFQQQTDPLLTFSDTQADVSNSDSGNTASVSWQVSISDSQALQVILSLPDPFSGTSDTTASEQTDSHMASVQKLYRITSWQVVSTKDWNGDNSVKLLQP